eukprot:403362266
MSINQESKLNYQFPQIGKSSIKSSYRQSLNFNQSNLEDRQSALKFLNQSSNEPIVNVRSSYDLKLKKSSKSVLQKYEKIQKGIQYLQPFTNNTYMNESRNDIPTQSNSLNSNLKSLKQQKQERYRSVQQSIQYEIPNLKSNDKTFDNDQEVFYSIDQTHEYDYVNASLKILPNMITSNPDKPLNFITKKKNQQHLRHQLKSLIDQKSPHKQQQSSQDLEQFQLNSLINLSNNKTSLQDLLDKNVGLISSSQMSSKHANDDNPFINQQLLYELSQMPSQAQLSMIGGQNSLSKVQLIPRRELNRMEEQLDEQEISIKERMIPKDNNLNFENHLKSIIDNQNTYQQILEEFVQKLPNKTFKKEKELLNRLLTGFSTQFKDLKQLSNQQIMLNETTIKELNNQIDQLKQDFDLFKQTQSMEAYFLRQLQDSTDPKEKREKFVKSIDDFMQADTLKKVWDLDQDERENNMDKSKFSGVNVQLKDIKNSMRGFKDISKLLEYMGIDEENDDGMMEGNVHQREQVVKQIENDMNAQMKDVQKTTAKKILARFMKQTQTQNAQCQAFSMEELTYDLQRQIDDLKDRGDSLRFEKIQLQIKNDKLQDSLTQITEQKRTIEKNLTQNCDLMQVEVQQIKLEKTKLIDDNDTLRQQLQDKDEIIKDLERKCEDKDYVQSRLNSLRNKYEEYDQVHNETERMKMNRSGSLHFNDTSDNEGRTPSSSNRNQSYKFQGSKLLSKQQLNQADSKQSFLSRNPGNQDLSYNQSSSRYHKYGGSHIHKNSQYSESQFQTNREEELNKYERDSQTNQTPRQRNKTMVRNEGQSSQQQLIDESRPISLGNSPRMNDMKVTVSQNQQDEEKTLKEKTSSQKNLANQKDTHQSKIAQKNKASLKNNVIANKDISHTQPQQPPKKSRNQKLPTNQQSQLGTQNKSQLDQNKSQDKIDIKDQTHSQIALEKINRVNADNKSGLLKNSQVPSLSQFKQVHQNQNRFKNSTHLDVQDSNILDSKDTLEIEQNQYIIEDEEYNQFGQDSIYLQNDRSRQKQQQIQNPQHSDARKSMQNSKLRIDQYEQDAYGRQLSITKARDSNVNFRQNIAQNQQMFIQGSQINKLADSQLDSTRMKNLPGQPDDSFYQELDPKYNTNELLLNNYKSTKDLMQEANIQRNQQQFSTIQQFPKIRSQVSIISRKSNNIPLNQEEYQTYQNQFSHNKSSDMIQMKNLRSFNNQFNPLINSTIQNTANATTHGEQVVQKKFRNVSTFAVQTENDTFMDQIIEIVQSLIITQLEQEQYKYTDKEFDILVKKTMDLSSKIKSKIGNGGDVFFKAGQFLTQASSLQKLKNPQSPQKGILEAIDPREQSPTSPSKFRVEDHFKVRLQKRAGGAGNFQRYGDKKNLRDPTQVLHANSITKNQH